MGILAVAATTALLYYGRVFFITVIIATIIAFLLEPMVEFFMKLRLPRGFASFLVCSDGADRTLYGRTRVVLAKPGVHRQSAGVWAAA